MSHPVSGPLTIGELLFIKQMSVTDRRMLVFIWLRKFKFIRLHVDVFLFFGI